jgi:hypothetical protein
LNSSALAAESVLIFKPDTRKKPMIKQTGLVSLFMVLWVWFRTFHCHAQGVTLVDFGSSAASTTFGLAGWNTVIKSGNLNYTAQGNGGLIAVSDPGEFGDFRGVRGTARQFSVGERIVVSWTNNSDETFNFTARISFIDPDQPDPYSPDGDWYTMRSFGDYRETYSEISPHANARTVFNITDSGIHKTDESYSLVNINLAIEWGSTVQKQFLICDKIELLSDADITPPSQPAGLTASVLSDSKIRLNWNQPPDNTGVVEYLIYMNGAVEGYSRSADYTCVLLEPETAYTFSVTALDADGNESIPSGPAIATTQIFRSSGSLINPAGMEYLGAIALPDAFNWGGEAVAWAGDGSQAGSLFVTNLNQPEYGLVGRVSLQSPVISAQKNRNDLNQALIVNPPVNIRPANMDTWEYVDIWRTGLEVVPEEGRLYSSWSIHYTVTEGKHASISCCSATDLAGSAKYGAWTIGNANEPPLDAMMNDWLFLLPREWADTHCSGRSIVTGRCRDGGLSGLGPTLYAFAPVGASPPAAGQALGFTTLLEYGPVEGTDNYNYPHSMDGYKHSDDWREAMWITADNQNAVAIVGNKAFGHNWYGYTGERMHHDWVIADVPVPEFWETDPDGKGWRAHDRRPMFIFYNPDDLARVTGGQSQSFEPQPYAALRIPEDLFFGRDHEIFSAAFDTQNSIIYVIEFVRELDGSLILHTWQVHAVAAPVRSGYPVPGSPELVQNFPNPFNMSTKIRFRLARADHIILKVLDLQGQTAMTLVDAPCDAGDHEVIYNAAGLTSGIYILTIESGGLLGTRKMVLIR